MKTNQEQLLTSSLTKERQKCPGCGDGRYRQVFIKAGFQFVRCQKCSLIYVRNISLFNIHQSEDYHPPQKGEESAELFTRGDKYYRALRILEAIERRFGKQKNISILDVGCGNGFFLRFLKENGYTNLRCVDINPHSVRFVKNVIGIPADEGMIENCVYPDESFDVVVMDQILEHVEYPNQVLSACYRILKRGGLLWISTPNIQSWHISMRLHQFHRHFTGRVHINHFTPKTLSAVVERNGFRVKRLMTCIEEMTLGRLKGVFMNPQDFDRPFFCPEAQKSSSLPHCEQDSSASPSILKTLLKELLFPVDAVLIHLTRLFRLAAYIEITALKPKRDKSSRPEASE